MPWILTETPYAPDLAESLDENRPVWQPTMDPNTWRGRYAGAHNPLAEVRNKFTLALRQAANIWREVLTQPDRDVWRYASTLYQGSRPGKKQCPANGWDLFAQVALGQMWYNTERRGLTDIDDSVFPTSLTFDAANEEAKTLLFTVTLPEHPWTATGIDLVYQIDPLFIGKPDAARRTMLCGSYVNKSHPFSRVQTFTVEPIFGMAGGDPVHVLVRHHASTHGVENYLLQCDPS